MSWLNKLYHSAATVQRTIIAVASSVVIIISVSDLVKERREVKRRRQRINNLKDMK